MVGAFRVACRANVHRFIFTIQPGRNSTEPMRAAGTPPPAVDKVAFVFSGVDACNCSAKWAVHWFSSSSAMSSTSWRMASAPLMRAAKARKASAIWSCTIRDPAQLLASIIACVAGDRSVIIIKLMQGVVNKKGSSSTYRPDNKECGQNAGSSIGVVRGKNSVAYLHWHYQI
jgi:hypothetical protein